MKRTDFFQLVQPLTEKLFSAAYALIPDDLQAEQLTIDAMNAFLFKEKKAILDRPVRLVDKKAVQLLRRTYFKRLLRHMVEIGVRRSLQLGEQLKQNVTPEFRPFYDLDPKVRFTLKLRYEFQFNATEIEDILQLARYEVIEKIHNGRFLLMNDLNQEARP